MKHILTILFAMMALSSYASDPISSDTLSSEKVDTAQQVKKSWMTRFLDYFNDANKNKQHKRFDFSVIGGPHYASDTKFGLGMVAAGLYRTDPNDSILPPSNVSLFGDVSSVGFYMLGVRGNHIAPAGRYRIDYHLYFYSFPSDFWGIGYDAGRYNPESTYSEKRYLVEGRYLHEFLPHAYIGGLVSFEHVRGLKFSDPAYLAGQKQRYTATGVGAILEYDSRDFIPSPFRGVYVSFQETLFPKGLGNCGKTLWRTTFTADAYGQVWKGGVLAADLYAVFNSDGTPWPMLARMGGGQRMRGYYQGRYTDNDMITVQVELRQRIWRRIGCAVWGGAGNVFPSLSRFDWSQTLPNYGAGLRWELKKRVNVRFDYGFGKKTSGFLLNINEAF